MIMKQPFLAQSRKEAKNGKELFNPKASLPLLCGFAALCALCLPSSASAQAPELGGLLPAGGPRGQVTKVRIDGKSLAGARVMLSGSGASVKSVQVTPAGDSLTAEIAVEAGALLGPREVRLVTAKGVSTGARFWVDVYPNRVIEQPIQEGAAPLLLDGSTIVVINGRIAAKAGRDRFVMNAQAGETWVFDCFADRIRSRFDPVLELRDDRGVSMKLAQSTWESDPRFSYRFAKAGKYFLTVRDSEYNGGPNYTYRLQTGRMPFIDSYSPRTAHPGQSVQVALQGVNLPMNQTTISVPKDAAAGPYWAEVQAGASGPLVLPMTIETEPVVEASDTNAPVLPDLPAAVDGVFRRSPRVRFTLAAKAGKKYLLDLLGRRIGSRIDGALRILDPNGKEIAANDDAIPLSKDARLEFTAPANASYTVEASNVEEITGSDCYFCLKASRVEPDFRLSIETDRLTAPQGGTVALPVKVERIGGFDGAVQVSMTNLPAGVTCSGGVIPRGKPSVDITLTAAPEAAFVAGDVHLLGTATIDGKAVTQEAPAWEKYEHRSIDLLLSVEYSYTRPYHLWDMLVCAVTERAAPITVTTANPTLILTPGGKLEIPVRIVRQPGANAEVKFELRNLPAKVTASAPPIPTNQTDGKIVLTAAADAPIDLANIILQATHDKAVTLAPAIQVSVKK